MPEEHLALLGTMSDRDFAARFGYDPQHVGTVRVRAGILYTGRIRYRGEIIAAEHPAIIDTQIWEQVQLLMAAQRASGGAESRTRHFPLLRGLLRCATCGCGMTYTYAVRGAKRYGYYTCHSARVQGAATCPMPSLPAAEVERLVVDEIKGNCQDPERVDRVVTATTAEHTAAVGVLRGRLQAAITLATQATAASDRAPMDAAQRALREQAEAQVATIRAHLVAAERAAPTRREAQKVLRAFEPVWAELAPRERQDLLRQLVSSIAIDGDQGSAAFTFRSDGIAAMANRAGAA